MNRQLRFFKQSAIALFLALSVSVTPISSVSVIETSDSTVVVQAAAKSFDVKDVPKYSGKASVKVYSGSVVKTKI